MIGLLASEFRRLQSRRLARVFVVLVLAAIVVAGTGAALHSHHPTDQDRAIAHTQYLTQLDACQRGEFFGRKVTGDELTQRCAKAVQESNFLYVDQIEWRDIPPLLQGTAVVVVIIAWLLGASSIGAEWQAGTMATLLTWEPRRFRVIAAKAVVLAASVIAAAIVLELAFSGALLLAAAARGSTQTDPGWLQALAGTIARVSALCGVAALFGASIAMMTRSAAAGMGAGFVYLAIVEGLVRGYLPTFSRFLIGNNATAWLVGHAVALQSDEIGMMHGGLVLLGYSAVLFGAAFAVFRVRDVT